MSTHVPGFHSFQGVLHHFILAKLAPSSIRVNDGGGNKSICEHLSGKGKVPILFVIFAMQITINKYTYIHSVKQHRSNIQVLFIYLIIYINSSTFY